MISTEQASSKWVIREIASPRKANDSLNTVYAVTLEAGDSILKVEVELPVEDSEALKKIVAEQFPGMDGKAAMSSLVGWYLERRLKGSGGWNPALSRRLTLSRDAYSFWKS